MARAHLILVGWLPLLIEGLPPSDREILHLVELDGLSQREAADRLGLSSSGARTRTQHARKRLRAALEACLALSSAKAPGWYTSRRTETAAAPDAFIVEYRAPFDRELGEVRRAP